MQFCYHLNTISVLTDLPYRLITGTYIVTAYIRTHIGSIAIYEITLYFISPQTQYNLASIVTLYGNIYYVITCCDTFCNINRVSF